MVATGVGATVAAAAAASVGALVGATTAAVGATVGDAEQAATTKHKTNKPIQRNTFIFSSPL
jgi:hypothetical protein